MARGTEKGSNEQTSSKHAKQLNIISLLTRMLMKCHIPPFSTEKHQHESNEPLTLCKGEQGYPFSMKGVNWLLSHSLNCQDGIKRRKMANDW